MLLGPTDANEGSMHLLGLPVPACRGEALARIGAIVEEPSFHAHLTGRENLSIIAAARSRDAFGRIDVALDRLGLTLDEVEKTCSHVAIVDRGRIVARDRSQHTVAQRL